MQVSETKTNKIQPSKDEISNVIKAQEDFFNSGKTWDIKYRKAQLNQLRKMILQYEDEIINATSIETSKPHFEAFASDIALVLGELKYTKKKLKGWAKKQRVRAPLAQMGSRAYYEYVPKGRVLVITPWNYPFHLCFMSIISAFEFIVYIGLFH